jgi:hypothetical protein
LELIFLTYINRSGSTYLAQILSSSEEILVCPEAEILVERFLEDPGQKFTNDDNYRKKLCNELITDWKFRHWGISHEELLSIFMESNNYSTFCSILNFYRYKIKPGATKIIFKAERIIYLWNRIIRAYNKNDLLHLVTIVRDPRGVYASQKYTKWPGSDRPFSQNPIHTSILWNSYIKTLNKLTETHPEIILIRFEDLLKYHEESIRKMSSRFHLKKNYLSAREGDFYARIPDDQEQIHRNIISQPIRGKENEWKQILNRKEIELIQCVTHRLMIKSGYILDRRKGSLLSLSITIILHTISFYFIFYINKILFWFNKIFHGRGSI